MVCVTGAGGTVGREVIKQLESAKAPFRAAYFSNEKADAARARGIDAVIIDYNRPENLRPAFQGCDQLFLLGPNALNQSGLERNAVDAAKAGVRHIVKQSVLGAVEESFSLAKVHRPVEKAIETSGLAWTFLRPNSFMQNVATYMGETIKAEGAFYSASGEAKISHVDVRDIAAVAVKALTEPNHEGKAYTLSGPEALTYDELASELSKVLGRTSTSAIRHINLSPSDLKHLRDGMLAEGMPEDPLVSSAQEAFDRVGRRERMAEPLRNPEAEDSERLVEPFPDAFSRTRILVVESAREILEQASGGSNIRATIGTIKHRADPRALALRQMVEHIPSLVHLTALDQRGAAEQLCHRPSSAFEPSRITRRLRSVRRPRLWRPSRL